MPKRVDVKVKQIRARQHKYLMSKGISYNQAVTIIATKYGVSVGTVRSAISGSEYASMKREYNKIGKRRLKMTAFESKYIRTFLKPVGAIKRDKKGKPEIYEDKRGSKTVKKYYCPECKESFETVKEYANSSTSYGQFPDKLPSGFNPFNTLGWQKQICKECEDG